MIKKTPTSDDRSPEMEENTCSLQYGVCEWSEFFRCVLWDWFFGLMFDLRLNHYL